MLKKIILSLLFLYQNIFSFFLKAVLGVSDCCRFELTCSEYARISVEKYGAFRGSAMAVKRFLSCQPFYRGSLSQ